MNYSLIINGSPFIQGNLATFFLIVFIVIAVGVGVAIMLRRKIMENEVLKYEFITIIAHKFRTPLTQLKWLIEGLVSTEQDSANRENLTDMKQSTDNLISLTGTLIELTNAESENKAVYQMEDVNVCDVTRAVTSSFKNAFHDKNIIFSVTCAIEQAFAYVDRTRLEFVMQTLLENSFHYTPPGRKVEVMVGIQNKKAIISVADNGIGIRQEDIQRIFSKFYRTENAKSMDTEGFGVGLYFSQNIIHRFGGKIDVYSSGLDRGSTFSIILPLVK